MSDFNIAPGGRIDIQKQFDFIIYYNDIVLYKKQDLCGMFKFVMT